MSFLSILVTLGVAHGLDIANFTDPKMKPEDFKVALAKWEAAMKVPRVPMSTLTCTNDFRSQLPSCLQYEPEWCWATAVAEIYGFFNPTVFSHESGGDCHGYECQVAGHILYPDDPQTCCQPGMMKQCGQRAGFPNETINAIAWTTGKPYAFDGPLSRQQLDNELSQGMPLAIGVTWSNGAGGHMLTLGGCAGGGQYYLHDPAGVEGGQANNYQTLSYDQILKYYPPNGARGVYGAWHQSFVYADSHAVNEIVV